MKDKSTSLPNTLLELRNEIDTLDQNIQALITKRVELAIQVAKVKKSTDKATVFYRPEREAQVLAKVKKRNISALSNDTMAMLIREIMSACLSVEQSLKIAYLGPAGTYTQEATYKHFGHSVECFDCKSIEEIFQQVAKKNAHYGVVPIENSSNGIIGASIDSLKEYHITVCGEIEISIHHQLMVNNTEDEITDIYSHEQSLGQCRRWLAKNYPNATLHPVASNAVAAKLIRESKKGAAIASLSAQKEYGLVNLASNIQDATRNCTRFLILGNQEITPSGDDKTSLLLITKHEAGALFKILEPFKNGGINILQLARHPLSDRNWEYLFFVDVSGHKDDEKLKKILYQVEQNAQQLMVLGSYPVYRSDSGTTLAQ